MGLGIFISAVIIVSIISMCFLKKRFWENRYLVLFISGCVAIVATLTTNYFTRNNLETQVETIWSQSIQVMGIDKANIDSTSFITLDKEMGFSEHLHAGDSTKTPAYTRHIFYYNSDGNFRVGYAVDDDLKSKSFKEIYFAPSNNDTIAYVVKVKQNYAKRDSKWIANISLPRINTIKCMYLPPAEYAMIPDSLLRELPFKL